MKMVGKMATGGDLFCFDGFISISECNRSMLLGVVGCLSICWQIPVLQSTGSTRRLVDAAGRRRGVSRSKMGPVNAARRRGVLNPL